MKGHGDAFWYSLKAWEVKDEDSFSLRAYLPEDDLGKAGLRPDQADEMLETCGLWKIRQLIDVGSVERGKDVEWDIPVDVLRDGANGSL